HLSQRTPVLRRCCTRPQHQTLPAPRRGSARHALPPDLPGIGPLARPLCDRAHPLRRGGHGGGAQADGDSVRRLSPVALRRDLRGRGARARRRARLYRRARRHLPALRLPRPRGREPKLQSRPHVRLLRPGFTRDSIFATWRWPRAAAAVDPFARGPRHSWCHDANHGLPAAHGPLIFYAHLAGLRYLPHKALDRATWPTPIAARPSSSDRGRQATRRPYTPRAPT